MGGRTWGGGITLGLLVAVGGCGQKGPLVLAPAAPAAAASAPGSTR